MINNFKQVKKFDSWMRYIHNLHYTNNALMLKAYEKIEPLTADRAIIDFRINETRNKIALSK